MFRPLPCFRMTTIPSSFLKSSSFVSSISSRIFRNADPVATFDAKKYLLNHISKSSYSKLMKNKGDVTIQFCNQHTCGINAIQRNFVSESGNCPKENKFCHKFQNSKRMNGTRTNTFTEPFIIAINGKCYEIYIMQSNTTVHFIILLVIILAFLFTMEGNPTRGEIYGNKSEIEVENMCLWQLEEEIPSSQFYDSEFTLVRKYVNSEGMTLFLIGTNHASPYCGKDVDYLIREVKPDITLIELCPSRTMFLRDTASYIGHDIRAAYKVSRSLGIPCILADQNFDMTYNELSLENLNIEFNNPEAGVVDYGIAMSSEEAFDKVIRSERDVYLARSILASYTFPNVRTIVCQVGLAHVQGIEDYLLSMTREEGKKLTEEYEKTWSLRLTNVKFREIMENVFFIENRSIGDPQRLVKLRKRILKLRDNETSQQKIQEYEMKLGYIDQEIERIRKNRKSIEL